MQSPLTTRAGAPLPWLTAMRAKALAEYETDLLRDLTSGQAGKIYEGAVARLAKDTKTAAPPQDDDDGVPV